MPFNRKLEFSGLHAKITLAFFARIIITTHATYGQHIERPNTRSPDAQAWLAISFVPHAGNPQNMHLNNEFRSHPVHRSKNKTNQNPRRGNQGELRTTLNKNSLVTIHKFIIEEQTTPDQTTTKQYKIQIALSVWSSNADSVGGSPEDHYKRKHGTPNPHIQSQTTLAILPTTDIVTSCKGSNSLNLVKRPCEKTAATMCNVIPRMR